MPLTGMRVRRPTGGGWVAATYLPSILKGMWITFRHLFRPKVTMQYPEETWQMPDNYRGLPALVRDDEGRVKCVACFLCEYVCPPKAIEIEAQEIDTGVEKGPRTFDINMLRCIMCGYCEEVCPEQAIFLTREYRTVGLNRAEMIFHKDKLLEMGGVRPDPIKKWRRLSGQARDTMGTGASPAHRPADAAAGGGAR
ncbi:MAG TPA: NADH-quinone oxidoreductase subunit NuoI [Candidatus Polarisedimenticolia bacterium]|nr:NADH-quinone oxidoreductase subunit NuoI [Candidatus Polarisedimenticolia bacterium]